MNIFIAGAGRVGFHLARMLSSDNNEITVLEKNAAQLEQIDYALDVSTIRASAADVLELKRANVGNADLFVAVTGSDEINLIAATTAKGLGAKQVVARVDQGLYIESNILYETILGIDYIMSPEALTALEIANYIENPGIVAAEDFGRGRVMMRQVRVTQSPTKGGKTLKDICPPGCGVLVGMITRGDEITIPNGASTVRKGDNITLIGQRDSLDPVRSQFQSVEQEMNKIVIMGGSNVGRHLANVLEQKKRNVKLIDWNLALCNELANELKRTKIVCRDATSRIGLEEEHVQDADIFVAATGDDERNIMASVLAKEVGCQKTVTVVHQPDFAPLLNRLGIDHAVTPRACITNRIMRLVHQKKVSSLAVLEEGRVEIMEFTVTEESPIIAKQVKDIRWPRGALVGTILRGDEVFVPSGSDEIYARDSVIMISMTEALSEVEALFRGK